MAIKFFAQSEKNSQKNQKVSGKYLILDSGGGAVGAFVFNDGKVFAHQVEQRGLLLKWKVGASRAFFHFGPNQSSPRAEIIIFLRRLALAAERSQNQNNTTHSWGCSSCDDRTMALRCGQMSNLLNLTALFFACKNCYAYFVSNQIINMEQFHHFLWYALHTVE